MPEIRLGAGDNLVNVNLGSTEVEEVRLGTVLVWRNNAIPVIDIPMVTVMGATNTDISVSVGLNNTVAFSYSDPDPADTISTITVTDPNGANVAIAGFTAGANSGTGVRFIIDGATFFTALGPVTANNVYTITITDSRGGIGTATVTITDAVFLPPTIAVVSPSIAGGGTGRTVFTITQDASAVAAGAVAQYSTDNGVTWITGATFSMSFTVTCAQGSLSVTILARSFVVASMIASVPASSTGSVTASSLGSLTVNPSSTTVNSPGTTRGTPSGSLNRECDGTVNYPAAPFADIGISVPGISAPTGFFYAGPLGNYSYSVPGLSGFGAGTPSVGGTRSTSVSFRGGRVAIASPSTTFGPFSYNGGSLLANPTGAASGPGSVARGGSITVTYTLTNAVFFDNSFGGGAVPAGFTVGAITGSGTNTRTETFTVGMGAIPGPGRLDDAAFVLRVGGVQNPTPASNREVVSLGGINFTIT